MVPFSSISEGPLRQCFCLDVRPFKGERSCLGVLSKMILWTCLGLGTAVSQHTLYEYLNNQPAHKQLPFANKILSFQQVINATGNAMSLIVNMSFQAAICLFFVQHFWSQIRRRSFTAKEINAIIDMQGNPLSFSALRMFSSAFQLFIIALIIFSLSVVSIVVPGSLTVVQGNFNQKQACNVPTTQYPYAPALLAPDNSTATGSNGIAGTSLPPIQKVAAKVMVLGSYLPPPTPPSCGTLACEYNVTFNAPAFQCNSTSSMSRRSLTTLPPRQTLPSLEDRGLLDDALALAEAFAPVLDPNSQPAPDPIPPKYVVWNATYAFNNTMILQVAWDMGNFISSDSSLTGPSGFFQCTAYNATYDVSVTHNTSESTVGVNNVVTRNQLVYPGDSSNEMLSMVAIADALATQLQGTVWLHPAGDVASGGSIIGYGLGTTAGGGAGSWNWTMTPISAIPSIMQNISLSLLAGNVAALSNSSTLTTVPQECLVSTLVFTYEPFRLAATYAGAAFVTFVCVYLGYRSIRHNKSDESIDFSRWIDAVAHQDILNKIQEGALKEDTPLRLRSTDGRLMLASQCSV